MKKLLLIPILLFSLISFGQNTLTTRSEVIHLIDSLASSGGGGSGDVVGPASATTNVPVLFDGTTGKLIKNSTPTGTGNPVLDNAPSLTNPDVTTQTAGNNSTKAASTAFVATAVSAVGGPAAFATWTSTVTGFSGTPTQLCRWTANGKLFTGRVNIFGTSNAGTFTFTLPSGVLTPNDGITQRFSGVFISNNGSGAITGVVDFVANSNVVTVFRDVAALAFTSSGGKSLFLNFTIEIQ